MNKLWRVLVTLLCIGTIMALPQGSTAGRDLAGSGTSALESWIKVGEQPSSLTLLQDLTGAAIPVGLTADR